MASSRVFLLLSLILSACADPGAGDVPGGMDGGDGKADGSGSDAGLCSPACADEANADVTCSALATCESVCSDGFARCGGSCVAESPQQCGDSCDVCPTPSHGTATCETGVCGVACEPGYVACDGYSGPGCCPYGSEVAAPSELGGYMSQVAVDAAGTVHVAYYTGAEHHLSYATMTSSGVTREALPRYWSSGGGAKLKLALGLRGPAIVYTYPNGASGLFVDDRRTSGWSHYKLVEGTTPPGFGVAGDRAGRLHVCYTDYGGGIHYAIRRGDQWTVTDVAADPDAKGACAIAAGPDGLPHIVYYRQSAGDVVYAAGAADGTFATQVIDSAGNVGSELAIAVDDSGTPHIAAHKRDTWGLRYATKVSGGSFFAQDLGHGHIGQSPSIAVTQNGEIAITYWDSTNYRVGITLRSGGSWQSGVFDELYNASASLASAPDGSMWMATGSGDVGLMHLIGDDWPTYAIDVEHKTGDDVTLLSRGGTPTLVYSTSGNDGKSHVEIATHQGAGWQRTSLSTEGNDSSAAIDGAGNVHVAYVTGTSVSYASEAGGLAVEQVAASASEPSLAVTAAGTPYVAYVLRSGTAYSLVVATRTGTGWSATTVGAAGAYGTYRLPVVRVSGSTVHLLWYDGVAKTIVYASSSDSYATKATVLTNASLAHDLYVGADGVPHACVFQGTSSSWPDLRYATKSGASWSTTYVAPPGSASNSGGCAITRDSTGTIGIARSLVYGAGLGELVLTTLGATTTHTVLQDDFYSAGLSITEGAAGLEVVGTGRPYNGSGHDQNRIRWAHR